MTPESAYLLRRHPEAGTFRKAWEAALGIGVERLEEKLGHWMETRRLEIARAMRAEWLRLGGPPDLPGESPEAEDDGDPSDG